MRSLKFLGLAFVVFSCSTKSELHTVKGPVFGTSYQILYYGKSDYSKSVDSIYSVLNNSMSNYQKNSIISKVNNNETVNVDAHFKKVFSLSKLIFKQTNGVFDPTIGKLVNAWGFGSAKPLNELDSLRISNLMNSVGFNKVHITNNIVEKDNSGTFIDFNAVAKGYALDVVADFLSSKHIDNYLIEIGGELRAKGVNLKKKTNWKVGIQNPTFKGEMGYSKVVSLLNQSMATSGTYRKFKIDKNGSKYAHIIDSKTGLPSKSKILSVSVITPHCANADAYATAFQSMGINKLEMFLKQHTTIKAYVIYEDDDFILQNKSYNNFPLNN